MTDANITILKLAQPIGNSMFRSTQRVKKYRCKSVKAGSAAVVHRHPCGLGGFAIAAILAEIAVAAMALRKKNSWQNLSNSVN